MPLVFASEEERKQHPIFGKISRDVFVNFFKGGTRNIIDDDELALINTPLALLEPLLAQQARLDITLEYRTLFLVALGHPNVLDELSRVATMMKMPDADILKIAAILGNLDFIKQCFEGRSNSTIEKMLKADQYAIYHLATSNGHLDVLEHLEEKAPQLVEEMIEAHEYFAYRAAACNGHVDVLKHLEEKTPQLVEEMIEAQEYFAYREAAGNGHLDVLKHLEEKAPQLVEEMIKADVSFAYLHAAENGYLDVLEHLEEKAPQLVEKMIEAIEYFAYRSAAENGYLDVLEHLEEKASQVVEEMIKADEYFAFSHAAENGHLDVLKHLEEKAPQLVEEMIEEDKYFAYRSAASNGHLDVLEHLEEKASQLVELMIKADRYFAYRDAASNGHLDVLKHLEEKAPQLVEEMIEADEYFAYRAAASNGRLDVLKHLEEKTPQLVEEMIEADASKAYRGAASNGHLDVLEHLEEKAPQLVEEMIEAHEYFAYRFAAMYGLLDVVKHLQTHPTCFAYAEMHRYEYSRHTDPFITQKLADLRARQENYQAENPEGVFDISDANEAKLFFYIMRNIIRRNDRALDDDLRFLLSIPAVKNLAHVAVTPDEQNELLRLALSTENRIAAELLLNIPAVRQLAEQNDYYRAEQRGDLNLQALARDRESSMTALTTGEQKRLDAAIKVYQPVIVEKGINNLMSALREQLIQRYQANPAKVMINGKEHILPLTHKEFIALKLSESDTEKALKAYYQNDDHAAIRYLSRPNDWMSDHASYVYVEQNPDSSYARWSTFEEYQTLITMFWLAANDAKQPPTGGHTLPDRQNYFIQELAHIGRAHNWDKTRTRPDGTKEEYDDLEGDKPSCYSGVKRRLFQSVIGHPLLTVLTKEMLDQEARSFVRQHFETNITDSNRPAINEAINKIIMGDDLDKEDIKSLKAIDISAEKIKVFDTYLAEKYGDQYNDYPDLKQHIKDRFSLTSTFLDASVNSHFSSLYDFAKLDEILAKPQQTKSEDDQLLVKHHKEINEHIQHLHKEIADTDKYNVSEIGIFSTTSESKTHQENIKALTELSTCKTFEDLHNKAHEYQSDSHVMHSKTKEIIENILADGKKLGLTPKRKFE